MKNVSSKIISICLLLIVLFCVPVFAETNQSASTYSALTSGIETNMIRFSQILNIRGPLPCTTQFETTKNNQVFFISGSAYSKTKDSIISIDVIIDNQSIGTLKVWANPSWTHLTLIPLTVGQRLLSGTHTITLIPSSSSSATVVDENDNINISVLEFQ